MTSERLSDELGVSEFGNMVELTQYHRRYPHAPQEVKIMFSKDDAMKLRSFLENTILQDARIMDEFPLTVRTKV